MFQNEKKINVIQGTFEVSRDADVVHSAVLGSCVAVCAYDELAAVGGMNHILLPGAQSGEIQTQNALYGTNLMELLLNNLFSQGARRSRLKLKLFGGASLLNSKLNVGASNVEFINRFVDTESLDVVSSSLGGGKGRQIEFHPVTGRSRQRFLVDTMIEKTSPPPVSPSSGGDIELF